MTPRKCTCRTCDGCKIWTYGAFCLQPGSPRHGHAIKQDDPACNHYTPGGQTVSVQSRHQRPVQEAIATMAEAQKRADAYNDHGSAMGICAEMYSLHAALDKALQDIARRAQHLIKRIDKWEAGERDVTLMPTTEEAGE